MYVFIYVFVRKSDATECFPLDGSDLTITVYRASTQEFGNGGANIGKEQIPNTEDTATMRTLTVKTHWRKRIKRIADQS